MPKRRLRCLRYLRRLLRPCGHVGRCLYVHGADLPGSSAQGEV